ncbi:MAG TPA: sigma factor-like helix-turn-helix DNA-binding protein [Solirubrobacteraceae bacterium]|nr:sigma factor-like helix-turn-helix DNA-binding protein [Solirubrobacteraceae bacterium]
MAERAPDSDRGTRFDALFAAHFAAVRAYVLRRRGAAPVDDVLSETFLVAWRRLDAVPEDALPWLLGVARRVLANQRRGEARRAALIDRLSSLTSRAHVAEPVGDVFGSLGDAIATLSAPEREALLLVAWEGLEPRRAARVVGCTPAAFRARLYRARRRLAAQLGESPLRHFEGQTSEEAR